MQRLDLNLFEIFDLTFSFRTRLLFGLVIQNLYISNDLLQNIRS